LASSLDDDEIHNTTGEYPTGGEIRNHGSGLRQRFVGKFIGYDGQIGRSPRQAP
jgi:hypothetical protein